MTSTETGESCARRLSFAKPVRVIFCKSPLETGIFHRLTLTPTSLQANPNVSAATFFSLSDFTVRNPRVKLVRMTRQDPRRFAKVPCSEGNPFSAFLCVCESISLLSLLARARERYVTRARIRETKVCVKVNDCQRRWSSARPVSNCALAHSRWQ